MDRNEQDMYSIALDVDFDAHEVIPQYDPTNDDGMTFYGEGLEMPSYGD
jgi:hypothetical protein